MRSTALLVVAWLLCAQVATAEGLTLTLERIEAGEATREVDAREARLLALRVGAGQPASPFLEPGRFRATWRGMLVLESRTKLQFRAHGRGQVKLTIADKVFLRGEGDDLAGLEGLNARVSKGETPLVLEYVSPPEGDGSLRVEWRSREFDWEPVPPAALAPGPFDPRREHGRVLRRGREFLAGRGCLRCHESGVALVTERAMPELAATAPDFDGIGSRLDPSWVVRWVQDPGSFRPQARMPAFFAGDAQSAQDVAAALAQLMVDGDEIELPSAADTDLAKAGGVAFARLGCVACHLLPSAPSTEDADDRIPLRHVAWKWRRGALAEFLREPGRYHAWTRMPNLRLTSGEASSLEAFLRVGAAPRPADAGSAAGDPARGKEILESTCLMCHALAGKRTPARARPLVVILAKSWGPGSCVAPGGGQRGEQPVFELAADEVAALEAIRVAGLDSLGRRSPAEAAARLVSELRCDACHPRDGAGDLWSRLQLETLPYLEGAEPPALAQVRPDLTWAGEKLRGTWMQQLFSGESGEPARPWLEARMPAFPQRAAILAGGLAAQHGLPWEPPEIGEPDLAKAGIGETLVGATGFACITCHGFGKTAPLAQFEFGAINLQLATSRLRQAYFHRWLRKPQRITPTSSMPAFVLDTGKTALGSVLDGDAKAQFDAIWEYLRTLR